MFTVGNCDISLILMQHKGINFYRFVDSCLCSAYVGQVGDMSSENLVILY